MQYGRLFTFFIQGGKGGSDSQYNLFEAMMYSLTLNPKSFNKYVQLIDCLVKNELNKINSYCQLSQIVRQTSDEISDSI